MKNPSIDLLKGVLILLVMAGHAMELINQQHVVLWIGGGFRMPLMIGISGYLLNLPRTRASQLDEIARRYGKRMLLPWLVAMGGYLLVSDAHLGWAAPLELLLRPPFHLWYIPVLFFLILVTRLMPLSPLSLLAVSTPVSLATMYGIGLNHGLIGMGLLSIDSRYFCYPIYFFFGMVMAGHRLSKDYLWIVLLLTGFGVWWWSGLYGSGHDLAFVPARLLMSLGLIALLPMLSSARLSLRPINHIGRESLFYYLWHPLLMGLALLGGVGAGATLALSMMILHAVSLLAARGSLVGLLLGVRPRRQVVRLAESQPLPA